MRPEATNNLQQLQQRLGSDVDRLLAPDADVAAAYAQPVVRQGLELRQVAGCQTGGTLPLDVGSFQIGTRSTAPVFEAGSPTTPRFGLMIDPSGAVTVVPPPEGLLVDGEVVAAPAAISVGSVIALGSARFMLASPTAISRRRPEDGNDPIAAEMPTPAKGRGIDEVIVAWARATRSGAAERRRDSMAGPDEVDRRSKLGPSEFSTRGPEDPRFARVPVGLGDLPYTFPADLDTLNGPTSNALKSLSTLPAVPIEVDMLSRSIAIVGPRNVTRPLAAWIAMSIAANARPDAAGLQLFARGNRSEWMWLDALPHAEERGQTPLSLLVVDEDEPPGELPSAGAVVMLDPGQQIPESCSFTIEVGTDSVTMTDLADKWVLPGVAPIGISSLYALEIASQMRDRLQQGGESR